MFEVYTYKKLLEDVLASAPEGIDTRQGSIFYDAIAAIVNKIAKLYSDLDLFFDLTFVTTATGEYLDRRGSEFNMARRQATTAKYLFVYTGTAPEIGSRFFHVTGYYFTLQKAADDTLYLEAETPGTECNSILPGDNAVPVVTMPALRSASFGEVYEYGTDTESDDSFRTRIIEKISGPAANGNKAHYKSWCESIDGVGRARIFPLWNGENTVKAVLISPLGLPVSQEVEAAVQEYVDPNTLETTVTIGGKTYNVGDGIGAGVANIGAHFTAHAADALTVNVTFTAELAEGATAATAKTAAEEAITDYLSDLVTSATEGSAVIVRISAIGAILAGLTDHIVDYSNLKLNNQSANITAGDDEVPVLGGVTVNVES